MTKRSASPEGASALTATQLYDLLTQALPPGPHSFKKFLQVLGNLCFSTSSSVTVVDQTPQQEALYGLRRV